MLHFRGKDPKTITDADKQQIERIMAKGDSLSEAHTALTLEIIKIFKDTKYPAKYIADAYSGFTYDQLKGSFSTNEWLLQRRVVKRSKSISRIVRTSSPRTYVHRFGYERYERQGN